MTYQTQANVRKVGNVQVDDTTGEVTEGRHIRPFTEWLQEQRQGSLVVELGEDLNALVDAVNTFHKSGELKLTIKIKPATRGDGMVVVIDDVSVSLPKAERPEVIYFIDRDANLSRANPAQAQLPLREVPAPDAPVTIREAATYE